ncbi:hypothetical protein ACFQ60_02490 [Streptomyces zhihengii]
MVEPRPPGRPHPSLRGRPGTPPLGHTASLGAEYGSCPCPRPSSSGALPPATPLKPTGSSSASTRSPTGQRPSAASSTTPTRPPTVTTRIPRGFTATARLLTPGRCRSRRNPCALSFLTTAERALTAPSARLLTTADSARAAAACASDDDLRNLLFTDIVGRWRHLIGATHRGWTHVHVVSEAVLDLVAA